MEIATQRYRMGHVGRPLVHLGIGLDVHATLGMAHQVHLVRASDLADIVYLIRDFRSRIIQIRNGFDARDHVLQGDIIGAIVKGPHARPLPFQKLDQISPHRGIIRGSMQQHSGLSDVP